MLFFIHSLGIPGKIAMIIAWRFVVAVAALAKNWSKAKKHKNVNKGSLHVDAELLAHQGNNE